MIKWTVFILAQIYTISYAVFELNNGNKKGFVAVMLLAIISLCLFVKYST